MEKKEIGNFVSKIELCSGVSQSTGKEYDFISVTFVNGYNCALFPGRNNDAMFIIKNYIVKD